MIPLTKEQRELYEKTKFCYIYKFKHKYINNKNYTGKYTGATHSICSLKIVYLRNSCRFPQWMKLWLSFYHNRASKSLKNLIA